MKVCQVPQSLCINCWNKKLCKNNILLYLFIWCLTQHPIHCANIKHKVKHRMQSSIRHFDVWILYLDNLFPKSLKLIVILLLFSRVHEGSSNTPHCSIYKNAFINHLKLFFLFALQKLLILIQNSVYYCKGCLKHHDVTNRKTVSQSLDLLVIKIDLAFLEYGFNKLIKHHNRKLLSLLI